MDERSNNHNAGDHNAEHDQPKGLPVSDAKTIACGLSVGDRMVSELTECVARRIISGARSAAINRERLALRLVRDSTSIWLTILR